MVLLEETEMPVNSYGLGFSLGTSMVLLGETEMPVNSLSDVLFRVSGLVWSELFEGRPV